ncbi:uncharacterized protein LOC133873251 [Alnus glutinosa]|uniref:uncharacterized protein LOC133873251 n=1 Tax=Alnus glutinosa TaxID=3517 RepID=UPI002D783FA3|nr:uncharacterized protein LOC133873251 [Alnus glutinosa]
MGNCAPQYHDLHHPEYPQINHQYSPPSSYNYPAQRLSLEETLQAFIQTSNRNIQELKKVTMSNNQMMQELKSVTMSNDQIMQELKTASISDNENIQNLAKIEGHIDYLHVPDTIILESNEIDNNEEEGKEEQIEHNEEKGKEEQIGHKKEQIEQMDQIEHIEEQEEKDEQIEHRDQIEQKEQVEHEEKIEPPADTSPSNDKEEKLDTESVPDDFIYGAIFQGLKKDGPLMAELALKSPKDLHTFMCVSLRQLIEKFIENGKLVRFLVNERNHQERDHYPRPKREEDRNERRNYQLRQEDRRGRSREPAPRPRRDEGRERSRSRPRVAQQGNLRIIHTISGGFGGGGESNSARKVYAR